MILEVLGILSSNILRVYYNFKCRFMSRNPQFAKYSIGSFSYGSPEVLFGSEKSKIIIGKYCSISDGVTILLGGEHRIYSISTYPFYNFFPDARIFNKYSETKGDVIIENDVWIGQNALILSGVKIGDGAVVDACSVVSKDVPPYSIVAGNPAKIVRMRFDNATIEKLLQIKWWNCSSEQVLANL